MSSARETETRARGATTNKATTGGDQKLFDEGCEMARIFRGMSLETILERLEIIGNV